MLSIGDFARLAGVTVRMLRHYDRLGLLTPARVDDRSGYRFYSATQLERANRLVAMKELGFALEQVGELLAADLSDERLEGLLRGRASALREQIAADEQRLRQVDARLRMIEKEYTMTEMTFVERELPALRLVQLSAHVREMGEIEAEIGPMFERVNSALDDAGLSRVGPGIAHYTATEDGVVAAAAEQVGGGAAPTGLELGQLPAAPRALSVTYDSDDLDGIQAAWQALVVEVERRGLTAVGTCREVYEESPMDPDGARWVVELQQPVA